MRSNFFIFSVVKFTLVSGARAIQKSEIPSMTTRLIKGIVLLEGSLPIDHLNPALKHLIHYGPQTANVGLLDRFSMFSFERKNKHVKSMVKHPAQPLSSLANHVELDILARIESLSRGDVGGVVRPDLLELTVRTRGYMLSKREKDGMNMLGVTSFRGYKVFKVAKLLGVHFRCGEWGRRRCGSVITTIYRGISRYCIVNAFVQVQGKTYASVTWLSVPTYPYPPFKIVVKVRMLPLEQENLFRGVISVDKIDPCTVGVIPDEDGVHFYMLRDKGTDR